MKRETSTINSVNYQTDHAYDRQGNETLRTDPDSSLVQYLRNAAGLLEQVQRKETTDGSYINVVSNFDRSPLGQPTTIAYQNGATTTNTYDAAKRYRLSTKVTTIASSVKAQDIAYTYDNVGNVTQIADNSATNAKKTVDYTYDDLHRLLTAAATNVASGQSTYSETYTYDAIGNIATKTGQGAYAYAGTGYANPHAATTAGGVTLAYDNNGNLLTQGSTLTNTWDYGNRLVQSAAGSTTSTYAYDPTGTRVKLVEGSTTTYYPAADYSVTASVPTKHITAEGLTLATITDTGSSAVPRYVHTDHLTGASVITNASNAQDQLLDYYPFGSIRLDQKAGSFSEQRKFANHEIDAATGLSYMGARYDDLNTGRFLSQDPAFLAVGDTQRLKQSTKLELEQYLSNPQHLNSYSYAFNNPLVNVDATGEFSGKTTAVGVLQIGKSVFGAASTGLQGSLAGMSYAVGYPQAGAILAISAMGNLDNGFVDMTNGVNNLLNGLTTERDPSTITSQGPIRNAVSGLMGDTKVFDGVTTSGNIMTFTGKETPEMMRKMAGAYVIHANSVSAGVGNASGVYMNKVAGNFMLQTVDHVVQAFTGGSGILDKIAQKLSSPKK